MPAEGCPSLRARRGARSPRFAPAPPPPAPTQISHLCVSKKKGHNNIDRMMPGSPPNHLTNSATKERFQKKLCSPNARRRFPIASRSKRCTVATVRRLRRRHQRLPRVSGFGTYGHLAHKKIPTPLGAPYRNPRASSFGLSFRRLGSGSGSGSRVLGSGFRVLTRSCEFRVSGLGLRVASFGSRVSGFGFRVSGQMAHASSSKRCTVATVRACAAAISTY